MKTKWNTKKKIKTGTRGSLLVLFLLLSCIFAWNIQGEKAEAAEQTYVFEPSGDGETAADSNARELNSLLSGDEKKTVILPKETIYISATLRVGDNTTIDARGATIIQTVDGRGILSQNVDGSGKYDSVKNILIKGGTWKNKVNSARHSIFRFCHGKNVKINGVKIITNYESHGIELIAMKNVKIVNSTVIAKGSKSSDSNEEAIQIDVATQATAPGVYSENSDSALFKGQTCQNILVKNNTISGSRGVCANYTATENGKWLGKFHSDIKIIGNTISGSSSEAVALFNTFNANVKDNTIITNSSRVSESYSVGLNIIMMGKPSSSASAATVTVEGNTIKGGRQALNIVSKEAVAYGGNVSIKNNKLYCKSGADVALHVETQAVTASKYKTGGNKTYKW